MQWLWYSLIASVALTVLVNLAIRMWPGAAQRGARTLDDRAELQHAGDREQRRVRVVAPWKAMVLVSVVATILVNVVLRLA